MGKRTCGRGEQKKGKRATEEASDEKLTRETKRLMRYEHINERTRGRLEEGKMDDTRKVSGMCGREG